MAGTSVRIPVDIDMSRAEKSLRKGLGDKVIKIKLDPKDFNQPLGRITGKLGEFDNALAASNARVIAFGASASAIYAIQRALSATVKSAIEVEKVLADINVILNASGSNLKKFGDQLFRIAGNTGQSFNEVAKAATELARQGLSVSETLKRTNDALVLTRLSGLGATQSVESLTAAINSFNKTAITSTEIINKMANVDAAFAVSSKDLAEAIRRVGSTAADANVSFDELIAAVTSAQQVTARGGAVIGNSFKTIFTRLQRPKVLDALEKLGIQTRSVTGDTRPAIKILKEFAKTYETLAPSIKATTSELIGGVFQINIVKAALADLNKEYSIYDQALKTSVGSTDEAIKRNEALNETMSAMINKTFANLQKVAAGAGEDMFGPMMKRLIGGLNGVLEKLGDDPDTKGVGSKIASGIFKGIGDFLSGPGLMLGAVGLFKIVSRIGATATDAMQSIVLGNKAHEKTKQLKLAAFNMLQKEPGLLERVLNNTMTIEQAHERVLGTIEAETNALRLQMNLAGELARKLSSAGVTVPEAGPFAGTAVTPKGGAKRAGGHKPDWLGETSAMANSGYSLSDMRDPGVRSQKIHDGRGGSFMASVNKHERVQTMKGPGGNKGTFVIPPKDSDAFKKLAEGLVPNFARTTAMRVDSIAKGRPSLHKYINYGEGGSPKSKKGSTRKYAPTKEYLTGSGKGQAKGAKVGRQAAMRLGAKGLSTSTKGMVGFDPMDKFDFDLVMKKVDVFNSPEAQDFIHRKKGGKNLQNWDLFEKYIRTKHLPSEGLGRGTMTAGMGGKYPLDSIRAAGKNIVGEEIKWFDNPRGVINTESGAKGTKEYYMGKALGFAISMGTVGKSPNKPWYNKKSQIGDLGRLNVYHPDSIKPNNEMIKMLGQKGRRSHASGFTPNFFKGKNKNPLYDLDGTIIKEGFFDWKDPNAIRKVTGQDLTPIGQSLLKSGKKFDIATARSLKDKGPIMQHLSSMGLNVGKIFPMASMYTSRTEMGKRGKPIKMTGPTKKGLLASTLGRTLVDNDMRNVDAVRRAGGRATKVSFGGGFVPNFAGASEAMSIFNRKGQQVKSSRVAHDWREMSSSDFEHNYGSKHAADRAAASQAGVPYSKWKQGKERSSRQASIKRITSPHVMLTSDIGLKSSRMTVDKRINDKKYKVSFPYGGLRKSPIGASNFKDLIDQELSGGMSNIYNRLGFKGLEGELGSKQRPEFSRVMRQSNIDQTMGNMFDGLVKKMIRGSSKMIDDDKASVAWDVPSTTGSIEKAFHTKGGLKGDLKLSAGKEGPSDFAEKVLSDKGIKRRGLKASGFIPSFANGLQKALTAEQMFGGRGASPVVDFSSELRGKGMSGLFVRDKKQKGMKGVKRDHGGLSNALKDAKGMQRNMAKGFIPNFATDDIMEEGGSRRGGRLMMASFMAPMLAQTLGQLVPAVESYSTALGEGAMTTGTIMSLFDNKAGLWIGALVGIGIAATSLAKKLKSKTKEFDLAAGLATEKLQQFSNGMQSYLTSLEAFNTATKDAERDTSEILRIHTNMVTALSQIDSKYRDQILSATSVEEAQKAQAKITKKITREAEQVKFAAEMQKTMDEMRDAFSSTEILGKSGNLGKLGRGLAGSIGREALMKQENFDQLLSGDQEDVIRKLSAAFDIDPKLAESLGDLTDGWMDMSNEFGALMGELKAHKITLDDANKHFKAANKLREDEKERVKEFTEAVKEADKNFVNFVNAFRASGTTLQNATTNTLNLRDAQEKSNRSLRFQQGKNMLGLNKGKMSEKMFLGLSSRLTSAKARGDTLGEGSKQINKAVNEQMGAIAKLFMGSLSKESKEGAARSGREISQTELMETTKFRDLRRSLLEGVMGGASEDETSDKLQELVSQTIKKEDQIKINTQLRDIQEKSSNKLAEIKNKLDTQIKLEEENLKNQKELVDQKRREGKLGGIAGFLKPVATNKAKFEQLAMGLDLQGTRSAIPRGAGAVNIKQSLEGLGLIEKGGKGSLALSGMAKKGHGLRSKGMVSIVDQMLAGAQGQARRRGDAEGFRTFGGLRQEVRANAQRGELSKTADEQLGLADLPAILDKTAKAVAGMSETFASGKVEDRMAKALSSHLDGSAFGDALEEDSKLSEGVKEAQKALADAQQKLKDENSKGGALLIKALENLTETIRGERATKNESTARTSESVNQLIENASGMFRNDMGQDELISWIKKTIQTGEGTREIKDLKQLQDWVRNTKPDMPGPGGTKFILALKDSDAAVLNQFIDTVPRSDGVQRYGNLTPGNARGYVPNFNLQRGYANEMSDVRNSSQYSSKQKKDARPMMANVRGLGKTIMNSQERIANWGGGKQAILTPAMMGRANGYVPNFQTAQGHGSDAWGMWDYTQGGAGLGSGWAAQKWGGAKLMGSKFMNRPFNNRLGGFHPKGMPRFREGLRTGQSTLKTIGGDVGSVAWGRAQAAGKRGMGALRNRVLDPLADRGYRGRVARGRGTTSVRRANAPAASGWQQRALSRGPTSSGFQPTARPYGLKQQIMSTAQRKSIARNQRKRTGGPRRYDAGRRTYQFGDDLAKNVSQRSHQLFDTEKLGKSYKFSQAPPGGPGRLASQSALRGGAGMSKLGSAAKWGGRLLGAAGNVLMVKEAYHSTIGKEGIAPGMAWRATEGEAGRGRGELGMMSTRYDKKRRAKEYLNEKEYQEYAKTLDKRDKLASLSGRDDGGYEPWTVGGTFRNIKKSWASSFAGSIGTEKLTREQHIQKRALEKELRSEGAAEKWSGMVSNLKQKELAYEGTPTMYGGRARERDAAFSKNQLAKDRQSRARGGGGGAPSLGLLEARLKAMSQEEINKKYFGGFAAGDENFMKGTPLSPHKYDSPENIKRRREREAYSRPGPGREAIIASAKAGLAAAPRTGPPMKATTKASWAARIAADPTLRAPKASLTLAQRGIAKPKDLSKEEVIAKAKASWEAVKNRGYANGYVPNFQGISDAVGREIRDGGVSRNQVRVHTNPDFVTNTRDEPDGKVPNFASSEEIKQILAVLKELLRTTQEKGQIESGKTEREGNQKTDSETKVKHEHSDLHLRVSGKIEETNSGIDKSLLNKLIAVVEKLNGGRPISPPKTEEGLA